VVLCSSVRANDWDDAKDKAEKFMDHKFTTEEEKTLVSQLRGYEDEVPANGSAAISVPANNGANNEANSLLILSPTKTLHPSTRA
jgi:hypothetical protein